MSLSGLCSCILVAWEVAVGWFRGVMLRQQNNEGPSSSNNEGPTASLQRNEIRANDATESNFGQIPISNQQGEATSQINSIRADSAKKSNFLQMPRVGGQVTHRTSSNIK